MTYLFVNNIYAIITTGIRLVKIKSSGARLGMTNVKGLRSNSQPAAYTPTGNGFSRTSLEPIDMPSKRPCKSDISPVYQNPSTNSSRKGTVM
jgi:hypothetical protein